MVANVIIGIVAGIYLGNEIDRDSGDSLPDEIKRCLKK
jgi:hypothetical protein